jgi:antibiotic biosynthesis monooxygenase (ABM) superfamily enzyme
MVTFDSDDHLEAWLGSEDRAALIAQSEGIARDTAMRWVRSGFKGWFDIARPAGVEQPAPWKFTWPILVGLYPIVMLEILFMNNKLACMDLAFSNLIGNTLSVALLGWPVVAVLTKLMGW